MEDQETVAITTLTDGNVALSIDSNACRSTESLTTIISQQDPFGVNTWMQLEPQAAT